MSPRLGISCIEIAYRAAARLPQSFSIPSRFRPSPTIQSLYSSSATNHSNLPNFEEPYSDEAEQLNRPGVLDSLGESSLQHLFPSGNRSPNSQHSQEELTSAQEKVFFTSGFIPSKAEAPALQRSLESDQSDAPDFDAEYAQSNDASDEAPGHKYPLPTLPLPPGSNLKSRYHPVIHQLTNLLMRDGKLSQAQRHMRYMLDFLRTSPAPRYSPKYALLPNAPPAKFLPLNPVVYLTLAVDSVAPLTRIKRLPGVIGGGIALEVPLSLNVRERRRRAWLWILDEIGKKPSTGSGKKQLAYSIAHEIIAITEGRSSIWAKREAVHITSMASRSNINVMKMRQKKRGSTLRRA